MWRTGNLNNKQGLCKLSAYKENIVKKTLNTRQYTYKENKSKYAHKSALPHITIVNISFYKNVIFFKNK